MQKIFLVIGTLMAGLAVALGAFGAHGLKSRVPAETLEIYQTGVHYQMYHALALLIVGVLADRFYSSLANYSGFFFIAGMVLFSGSLYLITSLKAMNKEIPTMVGIMTPVGGLFFILGWIFFLLSLLKK